MPRLASVDLLMKPSVLAATAMVSTAILFATDVSAEPSGTDEPVAPVVDEAPPGGPEIGPDSMAEPPAPPEWFGWPTPGEAVWAVNLDPAGPVPHALPPGVAAEDGLQTKTILVARSISDAFPQIDNIVGVRPDSQRWHPAGLALDVMIPDPGSSEGRALGDEVVAFALRNADRFGLQDAIWRGVYHTPSGPDAVGYGHFDHVHITTTGGGYPVGDEEYLREEAAPPAPDERG